MRLFDESTTEEDLWRIFSGDDRDRARDAREEIILLYQGLIDAAAHKLKTSLPTYINFEDLKSYGQIGLIRAVDTYDPSRSSFRSFAYTKIYGSIMDELRSQDWAPRGLRRDQRQISAAVKASQSETPSHTQIGDVLNWKADKVNSTMKKISNSSHVQLADRHSAVLASDTPEVSATVDSMCRQFVSILVSLPEKHCLIIVRKYFLNQTLSAIADDMGLSAVYVRGVHQGVLKRVHSEIKTLAV